MSALYHQIRMELRRLRFEDIQPRELPKKEPEDLEARLEELQKFLRLRRAGRERILAECSLENPNPLLRISPTGNLLDANRAGRAFHDALTSELGVGSTNWLRRLASNAIGRKRLVTAEVQCAGRTFSLTLAPAGNAGCVYLYGHDVSKLEEASRIAETLAMHDALTGLPNRVLLQRRFEHAARSCQRNGMAVSVAFVDVDDFKWINDNHGHSAGDRALTAIAHSISESLERNSIVARWGGDEFVVVFPEMTSRHADSRCGYLVSQVALRTESKLGYRVMLSYGLACFPADGLELGELIHVADQNLLDIRKRRCRAATMPA